MVVVFRVEPCPASTHVRTHVMEGTESWAPFGDTDVLCTPREAARMLRISERYLRTLTQQKKVASVPLGRRALRYLRRDLVSYIESMRNSA